MKIKVGNEYLEFDADIEIEKQCKLFEEISATQGDFSYSFEVPNTTKNVGIFKSWSGNEDSKIIYTKINAVIENNGMPLYYGYIMVQSQDRYNITCSFFSGNNNWFTLLNGNVKDITLSILNEDFNDTNITGSFGNTEGIIYPLINNGALNTRSYINLTLYDFHAFIYVHTIIKRIFVEAGLKLTGDLFTDWTYNHMITSNGNNETPLSELEDRSIKVGLPPGTTYASSPAVITFSLTTFPYHVGEYGNWTSYKYTAEIKSIVKATITAELEVTGAGLGVIFLIQLFKNGSEWIFADTFSGGPVESGAGIYEFTLDYTGISLEIGDYLEVHISYVNLGTYHFNYFDFSVTPTFIYKTFSSNPMPNRTKQDFVGEIFGMFNTLVTYDPFTKTVNVDFIRTVVRRTPINISQYLDNKDITFDYTEFISNYGRLNNFLYSESGVSQIENYNNDNTIPYGGGQIDSGNEHTEKEVDVLELDAVAVMETINNPLLSFLPELDFVSLTEGDEVEVGSVSDASGVAQFNVGGFAEGDLIRITNSTVSSYKGDWQVSATDGTTYFILRGINYQGDATLIAQKLDYEFNDSADQVYLLSIPDMPIEGFSNKSGIFFNENFITHAATAYFYKPLQGLDVDAYRQSLSWGPVNIPNAFQLTLLQTFWKDFERILRDPVKPIGQFCFPEAIFRQLDFTRPVRLEMQEFQADLIINKISGYKNSYIQCEVELIKL